MMESVSFHDRPWVDAEGGAPSTKRWLEDYGGQHRAFVECVRPANESELAAVLRGAARAGRRVTVRGGGQCLGGQSVGDDLVVELGALRAVRHDAHAGTLTAQAGALWGAVFEALPRGAALRNLVTTPWASVGGTLAGDAVSRFSSAYGREADGVRSVRVMAADGTIRRCTRDGEHAELFAALPGSLGAAGVILSVEHALVDVSALLSASQDGSLRMQTVAHKHRDARGLVESLAAELGAEASTLPRGVYGLLLPGGAALSFCSTLTAEKRLRRMPNHRRGGVLRSATERLLARPWGNRAAWAAIHGLYYRDGDRFVDPWADFAFFMGDAPAPGALRITQQVIEVPLDAACATSRARAAAALGLLEGVFRRRGVRPLTVDVVPVRGAGLRVATAFAVGGAGPAARAALAEIGEILAGYGGAVHLAKGVFVDPATIAATLPEKLRAIAGARRSLDPTGLLRSPFFERVLEPAIAALEAPAAPVSRRRAARVDGRRVALVTGASSGFGLLTSVELARRGMRVFASVRDPTRRGALDAAAAHAGVTVEVVALDVTRAASVAEAVAHVEELASGIDVLVNNAGIAIGGLFEDLAACELREMLETNLVGLAEVCRAVLPGMRERRRGRIINVSSAGGRLPTPVTSGYCATKAGVDALSEALRIETARFGVRVSVVAPGTFDTDIFGRNRRTAARAADPAGPFAQDNRNLDVNAEAYLAQHKADPGAVARAIARVAMSRRPARYTLVGRDAHLGAWLRALLPGGLYEFGLRRFFEGLLRGP